MKKQFVEHIKESLENFETGYNPADWSDLQNRLSKAKAGKSVSTFTKGLLAAVSIAAVIGLVYYFGFTKNNPAFDNSVNQPPVAIVKEINENPAKEIVESEPRAISETQTSGNNNSAKESIIAEEKKASNNKPLSSEKTEKQVSENAVSENKSNEEENSQVVVTPLSIPQTKPSVLSASFNSDANKVCAGIPIRFIPDNNTASCTYKWYFGDGETSAEQSPKHVYVKAGTYNVKLRILSLNDNKSDEKKNTVTVLPAPAVQINYTASEDNNLLINFEVDADKTTEWKWNFGDKQTSSEQNPSHTYNKKGNYQAVITAKNSSGCATTITKDVNVKNGIKLIAPNAFSPDGDGINDTWIPVVQGEKSFKVIIYDKFNNVVYTTSDTNLPWNGNNAKARDTFTWKAILKDKDGDESNYQGIIIVTE